MRNVTSQWLPSSCFLLVTISDFLNRTHAVCVARSRLPLSVTATIRNPRKGVLDIATQTARQRKVQLVSIVVRVRAVRVANFSASGHGDRAVAGALESDGSVDGHGSDLLEGGAGGRVAVAAAAGGADGDASAAEAGDGGAVGDLLGGGGAKNGGEGDERELEYQWLIREPFCVDLPS